MRSATSFRGHPLHPGLIPFPFAFLVGAFVFDLGGVFLDRPGLWNTGRHLAIAGVVMGVVAAIPGAIDYFKTVPPASTAKTRATRHGLANLSSVSIFTLVALLRDPATGPDTLLLALEALGVGLIMVGAWMGGTLMVRNQIGVDHRYAEAGQWNEASLEVEPGKPVTVASTNELQVNQMKLLHVDGRRIVLARTEEGYVAFQDRCSHRGGSLADGAMICSTVQCPWHGSQFDTRNGQVKSGPAKEGIVVYGVEEKGGQIRLVL